MSEEQTVEANNSGTDSQQDPAGAPQSGRQSAPEQRNNSEASDVQVPKYRFDEVSKRAKEAEKELNKLRTDNQQREEQAAQQKGEWEQVAKKRQDKIDSLNNRVKELENQIVRDKRFRAWTQGASGVIRSDALSAAFEDVSDEEWQTVSEEDENSVRMLAQGLVERRPWFAGDRIGAGSGGSSRPVLGLSSNKNNVEDKRTTTLSSGRQTFAGFKKKRSHWK